jgi:hypothetical protein
MSLARSSFRCSDNENPFGLRCVPPANEIGFRCARSLPASGAFLVFAPQRLKQAGGGSKARIERLVNAMFFENVSRDERQLVNGLSEFRGHTSRSVGYEANSGGSRGNLPHAAGRAGFLQSQWPRSADGLNRSRGSAPRETSRGCKVKGSEFRKMGLHRRPIQDIPAEAIGPSARCVGAGSGRMTIR